MPGCGLALRAILTRVGTFQRRVNIMVEPSMPDSGSSPVSEPHHVDLFVGTKIRQRRNRLHIDQDTLAKRVGVSFQQIQKYERGTNRVSASRLYDIAQALSVPIGYFFEDLERGDLGKNPVLSEHARAANAAFAADQDPLTHDESLALVAAYWSLPDDSMRDAFITLLKAFSRRAIG